MPMVISKCGELKPEFDIDTSTGQHRRQGQGPAWEASCVGQGLVVSWSGCEGASWSGCELVRVRGCDRVDQWGAG